MSLLEVANVSHRYQTTTGPRPVLDQVGLELGAGEILAIVGESGCGKTTLGRLVARLAKPTAGEVRFDGRDIWGLKGRELAAYRRAVQVVQQDPYGSLNPGLTIRASLAPALRHHHIVPRDQLREELLRLLQVVGLDATDDFLRRYPHQLSGGQRQRVAIARAISLRPRLIVADEAVSMLDVSMRVSVLDLMLSLRSGSDLAYLFVSHDFGVVRYFTRGGRVLVMFYGVVVEEGPAEDVIARPRHPYTYLLRQAIPIADPEQAQRNRAEDVHERTEGEPANTGCVFANRCPFAEAVCRTTRPPLVEQASGHLAACLFPERVPDLRAMQSPDAAQLPHAAR